MMIMLLVEHLLFVILIKLFVCTTMTMTMIMIMTMTMTITVLVWSSNMMMTYKLITHKIQTRIVPES